MPHVSSIYLETIIEPTISTPPAACSIGMVPTELSDMHFLHLVCGSSSISTSFSLHSPSLRRTKQQVAYIEW